MSYDKLIEDALKPQELQSRDQLLTVIARLVHAVRELRGDLEDLLGPNYETLRMENARLKAKLERVKSILLAASRWTNAGQLGDPNGAKAYQADKLIDDALAALGGK